MSIVFRSTERLIADVRRDLSRPHPFAEERVGFITVRAASTRDGLILIAEKYHPVLDEEYVDDPMVGARFGQGALLKALNLALLDGVGVFHVHQHEFGTRLWFSAVDLSEQLKFIPDFFKVRRNMPHGALVLSPNSIAGRVWLSAEEIHRISEFNVIGARLRVWESDRGGSTVFAHG